MNIVRLKADKTGTIATPHDAFNFESNYDDLDINISKQDDVLKLSSTIANIGAVILSRQSNGTWLRSDATMAGNKSIYEGVTVGNQLGTYPIESQLILNGGDMTNQPTVETLPIPALSLATDSVSITEKGGTVAAPKLTGAPETATVTYTSNNKSIATVNSTSGQVTAVGNGTAVITINVAATDTTSATSISFNVVVSGQANEGGSDGTGSGTLPGGDDFVNF